MIDLKDKLGRLEDGKDQKFMVRFGETSVQVVQDSANRLSACIDGEWRELPLNAKELRAKLEEDITKHTKFYGAKVTSDVISEHFNRTQTPGHTLEDDMRLRSLCENVFESACGVRPQALSHIITPVLAGMANTAARGQLVIGGSDIPSALNFAGNSSLINDAHAIDLLAKLENTPVKDVNAKVDTHALSPEQSSLSPEEKLVHNLIADLVFDEKSWKSDLQKAKHTFDKAPEPGERIKNLLMNNLDALLTLGKRPELLDTFPEQMRDHLRPIVDELAQAANANVLGFDLPDSAKKVAIKAQLTSTAMEDFARMEQDIKTAVGAMCSELQRNITEQFGRVLGAEPARVGEPQDAPTLKDLLNKTNANDNYARFMREAVNTYFERIADVDKASIVAAGLRYYAFKNDGSDESGAFLGALLKGAGPIMHKMLQGLPLQDEALKAAIKDMKDNLAPIHEDVVKAELLAMVERSGGEITKIDVVKSLGCASVGQALLCNVTDKNGNTSQCVVKLLRPDVSNRAKRELSIFQEAAQKVPGMKQTFQGYWDKIQDELDLRLEARNIVTGGIYNGTQFTNIGSCGLMEGIEPTQDTMALKLAEGTTLSKRIETIRARMNELLTEFNNPEARKTPGEIQAAQRELVTLHDSLNANQQQLLNLAHMWVTEGIYGQGFYHGDLHAGNIMVSDEKMTLIDFGNATSLSREQQANIMLMMAAASVSSAKMFLEGFEPLLSPAGKAALKEKEQQVRAEVKRILSMGEVNDTGERIAVVLKTLQNMDIELPAPIFNFSQCQIRLQNAIDDTNALLDELAAAIPSIGFSEDEGDDTRLMRGMNPIEDLRFQIGRIGVGPAEVNYQMLMESVTIGNPPLRIGTGCGTPNGDPPW